MPASENNPENKPKKQEIIRDDKGRFVEGHSGNPKGRPPGGHSVTETIQRMMDSEPNIKKKLGKKVIDLALDGDLTAIKLLWNYLDGTPTIKHGAGEGGEGELTIRWSGKDNAQDDND